MVKLLRYGMLSDEEILQYAEIVNKSDPNWAKKADEAEKKQKSLWRTVLTGFTSYFFYGSKGLYHSLKHLYIDSSRMEKFIEQMKTKYGCDNIDVVSFPGNWLMHVSLYGMIPWEAIEAAGSHEAQKEILQPIIDDAMSELPESSRKEITEMILNCENIGEEKFFKIIGEKTQEEEDRQFSE